MEVIAFKPAENIKKTHACNFEGCTSVFDRPYRLAQHRLVHDNNLKSFVCKEPNCEKAYTNKSHLDRHIKSAHKETEPDVLYCCPKCMKKYVNRQNLKRHIKVSHIDNNKPFCCHMCRMYFKKKHQLRAHMYIHNGLKSFRCPKCDRDFVTLYERKKHMKNHKIYQCEHCDEKYTRWTDLMSHKRNTHISPEYICHDCGKVFKERGHIVRHVKKHLPNTPGTIFFCPYENCTRHYSRKSNLKQHITVKHEGLTFDCPHCETKLSTKAKLNKHLERHNISDVVVKEHKTLATGRKKRKDAGTIRYETAQKLAGIVKQKLEGISSLYDSNMSSEEDASKHNKETEKSEENNTDNLSSPTADTTFREKETIDVNSNVSTESNTLGVKGDDDIPSTSNQTMNIQNPEKSYNKSVTDESNYSKGFLENFEAVSDPCNSSIVSKQSVALNRPNTLIDLLNRVDKDTTSQTKINNEIIENLQASLPGQHSRDLDGKRKDVLSKTLNKSTNNILPRMPNAIRELFNKINTGQPQETIENVVIKIEPLDTSTEKDKNVGTDHSYENIEIQIKIENNSNNQHFSNTEQQIKNNSTKSNIESN